MSRWNVTEITIRQSQHLIITTLMQHSYFLSNCPTHESYDHQKDPAPDARQMMRNGFHDGFHHRFSFFLRDDMRVIAQNVAHMQRVEEIAQFSFSIRDAYVKMLLTIFKTRHNITSLSTLATGGHHGREEKDC